MEWDYSSRKGRDGQKKKIGKANERKEKVKGEKMRKLMDKGEEGCPGPTRGQIVAMYLQLQKHISVYFSNNNNLF